MKSTWADEEEKYIDQNKVDYINKRTFKQNSRTTLHVNHTHFTFNSHILNALHAFTGT